MATETPSAQKSPAPRETTAVAESCVNEAQPPHVRASAPPGRELVSGHCVQPSVMGLLSSGRESCPDQQEWGQVVTSCWAGVSGPLAINPNPY